MLNIPFVRQVIDDYRLWKFQMNYVRGSPTPIPSVQILQDFNATVGKLKLTTSMESSLSNGRVHMRHRSLTELVEMLSDFSSALEDNTALSRKARTTETEYSAAQWLKPLQNNEGTITTTSEALHNLTTTITAFLAFYTTKNSKPESYVNRKLAPVAMDLCQLIGILRS